MKLLRECDLEENGNHRYPLIEGMLQMKTNFKMAADCSDETIADLMTDGGNMGVKSFSRYLNQHKVADKTSKELTKN